MLRDVLNVLTGKSRRHAGAPQPALWLDHCYNLHRKAERRRSVADLENLFFRLVKHFKPALFAEIGAKTAKTSCRARRRSATSRIVAFEANPLNFEAFGGNPELAEANVEYLHMALADRDGTATFNIVLSEGKLVNGRGSLLVNTRRSYPMKQRAEVPCRRFDSFFDGAAAEGACLWIDVEGANREVLEGGGNLLPRAAMIFIEVEDRMKWQGQWLYSDVARHLVAQGHVPAARDFQSRVQHNVLFLRQDLAGKPEILAALARYRREAEQGPSTMSNSGRA